MLVEGPADLGRIHVGQAAVVGRASCHHDVVHCVRQHLEESSQSIGVGGIECGGAQCPDLASGPCEPIRIAASQNDLSPLGLGPPSDLEPDAGAPANDHDRLRRELRAAPSGQRGGSSGHRSSIRQLAMIGSMPGDADPDAISFRRTLRAVTKISEKVGKG